MISFYDCLYSSLNFIVHHQSYTYFKNKLNKAWLSYYHHSRHSISVILIRRLMILNQEKVAVYWYNFRSAYFFTKNIDIELDNLSLSVLIDHTLFKVSAYTNE